MYQLGKLIVECLAMNITCGDEEQDLYRSFNALGEKMQQERPAATMMLKDIYKRGCKRCAKFERAESASSLTRPRGRHKNSRS
jgi:hypothetical protein